jgi:hypothetical protein
MDRRRHDTPPTATRVALALALGALVSTAEAQSPVRGTLVDPAGQPVAGGEVLVFRAGEELPASSANANGEWNLVVPEAGQWEIRATAEGYSPSEGWLQAGGNAPPLVIALEPDPGAAAKRWLDEGNRLLEAGQPAEARASYESALTVTLGELNAPIRRAAARACYLAGDVEAAYRHLVGALINDPDDADTRQLLLGVADNLERREDAEEWLKRLDDEGPSAAYAAGLAPFPEKPLDGGALGRFSAPLEVSSPLGAASVVEERLGREFAEPEPEKAAGSVESAELYVPEACGKEACGLFVWVSPTDSGRIPTAELQPSLEARPAELIPVLDERRVIWAAANGSGNQRHLTRRIRLALDVAQAVTTAYQIDPERVFVGGYSGGGRIASRLVLHYPEVFRGGLFYMGVDFWENVPIPHRPGTHWPPKFDKPSRDALKRIRESSRFVFATGEYDFNRTQTYATLEAFASAGLDRATLIDMPGVGHYWSLKPDVFEQVLTALDAR